MKSSQLITACLCGVPLLTTTLFGQKPTGKPNILFILADDQRADALGCTGNNFIKNTKHRSPY